VLQKIFNGSTVDSGKTRFTYSYDSLNRIDSILAESWDNDHWRNSELKTYSYTNISYYTYTRLTQQWGGLNSWVNSMLESVAIALNGNLMEWTMQTWANGYFWRNETRKIYNFGYTCVLPLHFISFTGEQQNKNVNLQWQTSDDINTVQFTIQRSTDGINFINIGMVKAKQPNSTNNYTYTDNVAASHAPNLFYRLQITGKDGKVTTSEIIKLSVEINSSDFILQPNPAKNYFTVASNGSALQNVTVNITDVSGRTVLQQKISGDQKININTLKPGCYFVRIVGQRAIIQKQLVME
jgi:hypothetical protein